MTDKYESSRVARAHQKMMKASTLRQTKARASTPKAVLIALASDIEEISKKEAERLRRIIARLEDWQNF